jgi:hypothetical protein
LLAAQWLAAYLLPDEISHCNIAFFLMALPLEAVFLFGSLYGTVLAFRVFE